MPSSHHRPPGGPGEPIAREPRYPAVSGIVLAGGQSRRLGQDKALVTLGTSQPLIARVVEFLAPLVAEVVVVCDDPGRFGSLPVTTAPDLYPGVGPLGGIFSGLVAAKQQHALVVGCDMPFLNQELITHLLDLPRDYDLLLPRHSDGLLEPLHAVYCQTCREVVGRALEAGRYSAIGYLDEARVRYVEEAEIVRFDPDLRSFFNVNTPADLRLAAELLGTWQRSIVVVPGANAQVTSEA